jgi:hypothetical protein
MVLSNKTLLPTTTYGVPSGNYNGTSPNFIGEAVPAADYYAGQGTVQTARIQVTDFMGVITLQATLGTLHEQAAWVDVGTYGSGITAITDTAAINIIGNFVWLRATVTEFAGGTVNSTTVVY